jgi:hypothetical protein
VAAFYYAPWRLFIMRRGGFIFVVRRDFFIRRIR